MSFAGIFASTICPMRPDGAIDPAALDRHLAAVVGCAGIAGVLINGHAGENAALRRDELRLVVQAARRAARAQPIVAGVLAESSAEATAIALDAQADGADAVMVFPPFSWALGADPRTVLAHHRAIHDAVALPVFLFQGPASARGMSFPPAVLTALLGLPRVAGIKEGSWDSAAYDALRRLVAAVRPSVPVMASGDEHLFACMAAGTPGSLVSLACVIPELIVALRDAVDRGELAAARRLHERIQPLARAIYGTPPPGLASVRLKACLHLLGRLDDPTCRAPLPRLDDDELAALRRALELTEILP